MPKLIINRSKNKKSPLPPCGRRVEFSVPCSPFQKLIDSTLKKTPSQKFKGKMMSYYEAGQLVGMHRSVLWAWTHIKVGYPHPRSCTPLKLAKLAKALSIPLDDLKKAYDASRHLFTSKESPMPHANMDAFDAFIDVLRNDKRKVITVQGVLNTALRFRGGAAVPGPEVR